MSVELLINIVVICLLVPTIVFAIILNKRLEVLRNSRADLGRLIEAFNDATTRAESGIPRLKQAADSAGGLLRDQIQKAQILRDDLAFMVERADAVARRLENATRDAAVSAPDKSPFKSADVKIDDLPSFAPRKPQSKRVFADEDLISSAVSAAQDILRDSGEAKKTKTYRRPLAASVDDIGGDRSEAEREMLKALQSGR